MSEISELIFAQYTHAAGLAAMVELRMRLLASRTPELAKYTHDKELESLEMKIHEHFDARFTTEEKDYLKRARNLRNKILHSDFKSAANATREIMGSSPIASSGPRSFGAGSLGVSDMFNRIPGKMARVTSSGPLT